MQTNWQKQMGGDGDQSKLNEELANCAPLVCHLSSIVSQGSNCQPIECQNTSILE